MPYTVSAAPRRVVYDLGAGATQTGACWFGVWEQDKQNGSGTRIRTGTVPDKVKELVLKIPSKVPDLVPDLVLEKVPEKEPNLVQGIEPR